MSEPPPVILASASTSRARLLAAAGIAFDAAPAMVDEDAVKLSMRAEGEEAEAVAVTLAALKAERVSTQHPETLVIGADQLLVCEGRWFDKPVDMAHARAHLQALCGRRHGLATAVVVARGGSTIWHHSEVARLKMRRFSDAFLDRYLEEIGEAACETVGGYRLEALGVQLFEVIEGSHFTILGLPLLPLLAFLREHRVLGQ